MITNALDDAVDYSAGEEDFESSDETFRQLPRNIEAEAALLGAIFVDNRALENVSEYLRAEHFALTAHARIYEAMEKLIERGQIADPTTLRPYFQADDSLNDIGGSKYLAHLAASAIIAAIEALGPVQHGRLVRAATAVRKSRPGLRALTLRLDLIALAPGRLPRHIRGLAAETDLDDRYRL